IAAGDVAMGMILSQTVLGILGNFSLIYHYLFFYITGCRLSSTDLIIKHLTVANTIVAALVFRHFLHDSGCKFLFYIYRVGRGVAIGSTCLLSVFQAITISPRSSRWAEPKAKALNWILHVLVNITVLTHITGKWSNKNTTKTKDLGYCSAVHHQDTRVSLNAALLSFPDVICVGLMLWASSSMLCILHIHRSSISPASSPDTRATKTILLLLSTSVSFYTLSLSLQVCLIVLNHASQLLVNMAVINAGFPAVSSFILMSGDSSVSKLCFAW
uniref:Vomeronasal type-1 receptor n=1 Tax=Aotus nancymaae TaxID=37293 RepID=A0A2K5CBP0_AOTNA